MIEIEQFPLLAKIKTPEDLRALSELHLPQLAVEIREFICQSLNISGGHFGANLGAVELTLALHYIFNTPEDRLIWDVGHQAYPHKILTGRRDRLYTIRKTHGLAPFPRRGESIYDHFGVGHSSTSISAALGMAIANNEFAQNRHAVAIIGDGAISAGMAFEALNHAGHLHANLLVVLNDNDMSISHNVGALSNYFARIISGKLFSTMREGSKHVLKNVPPMWELAKRAEMHVKGMITPGTLFEELGFYYIGPVDGHDINALLKTLRNLYAQKGPKILHVVTKKGKGFANAEADPISFHAVAPGFYSKTASPKTKTMPSPTYSQVFGEWICDMAEHDERIMAITPAMREGSGLVEYSERFPTRYFDVAIAEQHAVTLAAGLACEGAKPVVAIYSTFLQRAYDQLIHDVAIQNLPVLFAIDRAGIVGGDGTTHNGAFDLSFMRAIPNLVIMAPADENECRQMLYTGYLCDGPAAVRYPRGTGPGVPIEKAFSAIPLGKAKIIRQGQRLALLAVGSMCTTALQVAEILDATVVNMRFVKPLDVDCIVAMRKQHEFLVTLEENAVLGGAGSAINEVLLQQDLAGKILNLGLPDYFIDHGSSEALLKQCALDREGILQSIITRFKIAVHSC